MEKSLEQIVMKHDYKLYAFVDNEVNTKELNRYSYKNYSTYYLGAFWRILKWKLVAKLKDLHSKTDTNENTKENKYIQLFEDNISLHKGTLTRSLNRKIQWMKAYCNWDFNNIII